MAKKAAVIMPQTREILAQMGEQIRLARLRRKLSLELVAERAGISRATLISIEKGTPTVSIGSYAAVLHALNNMDSDLLLIAKDDEFGRKLQDLALPTRRRAPKKGADIDLDLAGIIQRIFDLLCDGAGQQDDLIVADDEIGRAHV